MYERKKRSPYSKTITPSLLYWIHNGGGGYCPWSFRWYSSFLITLGLGVATALFSLVSLISRLLSDSPALIWSFFFGLVLASVYIVRKRVVSWQPRDYLAVALSTVATYFLVGAVPIETPNNPLTIFLSGVIAICAIILPGISGLFLLVIMGKYEQILTAVTNHDYLTLVIFALGCVVGLAAFSRVLSWAFKHHHDVIIATLIGFMLGSLRKVWPWKEIISTRLNSHGEIVPVVERNILPTQVDSMVIFSLGLFALEFLVILMLDKLQVTKEKVSDVNNPTFEENT